MGDEVTQKRPLSQIPPENFSPGTQERNRYSTRMRIAIYTFLLLVMVIGGFLAYGYSYFQNNVQIPLQNSFHSVSLSNDEPSPDHSAITRRPWPIFLLARAHDTNNSA